MMMKKFILTMLNKMSWSYSFMEINSWMCSEVH
ncbi:hypothetical protein FB6_0010 [Serratia marcescens]|nr:hypothetical protein FB6_0010 [Serratia marcescens]